MGRGQHKDRSHGDKRKAYNARKAQPNYKKGGLNRAPDKAYNKAAH